VAEAVEAAVERLIPVAAPVPVEEPTATLIPVPTTVEEPVPVAEATALKVDLPTTEEEPVPLAAATEAAVAAPIPVAVPVPLAEATLLAPPDMRVTHHIWVSVELHVAVSVIAALELKT
jgi:hypothetical protein